MKHQIIALFTLVVFITVFAAGGRDFWVVAFAGILLSVNLFLIILLNSRQGEQHTIPPLALWAVCFLLFLFGLSLHNDTFNTSRLFLLKMTIYFLAFLCSYYFCNRSSRFSILLIILVSAGTVFSLYGLFIFLYQVYSSGLQHSALSATFVNKNHFAGFLEMVIPCAVALFFFPYSKSQKAFILYPLCIMIAGLGFSMSRGGWISMFVGIILYLLLFLPYTKKKGKVMPIGALVLIITLSLITFYYIGVTPIRAKIETTLDDKYLGMQGRLMMWESAFKAIKENPWGLGLGTFPYRFQKYRPRGIFRRVTFAHNDYIHITFETGILGFVLIVVLIERMYSGIFTAYNFYAEKLKRGDFDAKYSEPHCISRFGLLISIAASVTAIVIHSMVDFNLHMAANGIIFSLLVGAAMRIAKGMPKEEG